ncbi:MAG: DsbA family oxidoreductase [Solirubrobacteraceae bacterium]
MAKVHASYYTDPVCPWSWAMEPALRGLQREFGEGIEWTFVMGGLAREIEDDPRRIVEWLEAGDQGAMPVDPRIWAGGPASRPRSSYPACIAVKAAAEQGDPARYLRRLREGLLARRRKLDTTEALIEEARAVPEMDVERFRIDLASNWTVERFGADLERASEAGERAGAGATTATAGERRPAAGATAPALIPGGERGSRVQLPSVEFVAPGGEPHGVYGFTDLAVLRSTAVAAGAEPLRAPAFGVEDALTRLGALATSEVAAVCDLPGPRAAAELWRLALEWRVRAERVLTGELWTVA